MRLQFGRHVLHVTHKFSVMNSGDSKNFFRMVTKKIKLYKI